QRDPATLIGQDFFNGMIGLADSNVSQIPYVYAWDDHDFCKNNADENTCNFIQEAFLAYDSYYIQAPDNWVSNNCASEADFQSFTYGSLAQIFYLDARSNRDSTATNDPNGMLGSCQEAWLENGIKASGAIWKIVMTPVPM